MYSSRDLDESARRELRSFSIDGEFARTRDADPDVGYSAPDYRCLGCRSFETTQTRIEASLNPLLSPGASFKRFSNPTCGASLRRLASHCHCKANYGPKA